MRVRAIVVVATLGLVTSCSTQVARSQPAETPVSESEEATQRPTPTRTPRPTPRPTPTAAPRVDVEVTESGFSTWQGEYDDGARLSWAVILSNPNPADTWIAQSLDVRVSFLDAGGGVVASATDTAALILPGQQVALVGSDSPYGNPDLELIDSMEVRLGQPRWDQAEDSLGEFTVSGVQVRSGQFGDATVTGVVASTFAEEIEEAYAVAVYRNSSGRVLGGDFTFIDFIPAGDSIPFEISGFGTPPNTVSADVFVAFSFLSL